ncbi:MAG: DNA integrity scanning protein DisA nucleotide-binding domain protein, partial [Clostridia bacterium]|nr:DNA integrity scanning protein DisA nucleotide-binding domain protein [Clostridia bacterium]
MGFGKDFWVQYWDRIKHMAENFNYSYILEFIIFALAFYLAFRILKGNKGGKLIALFCGTVIVFGIAFSLSTSIDSQVLVLVVFLLVTVVVMMFDTEIKRSLLGTGPKKHHAKGDSLTVRDIEFIIDEITHAVQHMSKNDIGALIVLSNGNLPEGIISSGTVINADINAPMVEAVFYPKAPLHDGAMIIEGQKIHAAGCFLPLIQNNNLPQEVGSRHRAALGVTTVASVTSIVVSEETGVSSLVRDGEVKKKYANGSALRSVIGADFWTDVTG